MENLSIRVVFYSSRVNGTQAELLMTSHLLKNKIQVTRTYLRQCPTPREDDHLMIRYTVPPTFLSSPFTSYPWFLLLYPQYIHGSTERTVDYHREYLPFFSPRYYMQSVKVLIGLVVFGFQTTILSTGSPFSSFTNFKQYFSQIKTFSLTFY